MRLGYLYDPYASENPYSDSLPTDMSTLMVPNFGVVRETADGIWVLIRHKVFDDHTRWVRRVEIEARGIEVAYYDADPTFLPKGERP